VQSKSEEVVNNLSITFWLITILVFLGLRDMLLPTTYIVKLSVNPSTMAIGFSASEQEARPLSGRRAYRSVGSLSERSQNQRTRPKANERMAVREGRRPTDQGERASGLHVAFCTSRARRSGSRLGGEAADAR
jgi:hypothetical protein